MKRKKRLCGRRIRKASRLSVRRRHRNKTKSRRVRRRKNRKRSRKRNGVIIRGEFGKKIGGRPLHTPEFMRKSEIFRKSAGLAPGEESKGTAADLYAAIDKRLGGRGSKKAFRPERKGDPRPEKTERRAISLGEKVLVQMKEFKGSNAAMGLGLNLVGHDLWETTDKDPRTRIRMTSEELGDIFG